MNASPPPPPIITSDEKLWIVLSHLSLLFGFGLLLPFIIYLVKRADSPFVRHHSAEALNFHISLYLYLLACVPLWFFFIGIPIAMAIGIAGFILSIIAAIRATDGIEYRYPLTIRLVT